MRAAFVSVLILTAALTAASAPQAHAQFEIQDSTTTADLRGVSAPGNGVAWASGTHGTVVRTEDGGYMWQGCSMPPGAEHLDFRGIQAFDDRTALVMSSGKGKLSRIYKTTDGCQSWKLVFTNPDADGFFDALYARTPTDLVLLGDPVHHGFPLFETRDGGLHWTASPARGLDAEPEKLGAFAASNSSLVARNPGSTVFGVGGTAGAYIYRLFSSTTCQMCTRKQAAEETFDQWTKVGVLPDLHSSSSGVFSICAPSTTATTVAVGGDYQKPDAIDSSAIRSMDGGQTWQPAQTPPHGYRSSVAYDALTKTWITTGPNGTDVSMDDGRNWRPLRPMPGDTPDTDRNWNALALPWVVGPHGRIGKLHDDALTTR